MDLRERRRRATLDEIAHAAVELFEEQGVSATTVEQIAARAGVSSRTFFRYCRSKEHALIAGDDGPAFVVERTAAALREGASVLSALDSAWLTWLDELQSEARYVFTLRVRRLVMAEPALLSAVLASDAARADALTAAVAREPVEHADPRAARGAVVATAAIAQAALAEGARAAAHGETVRLGDVYVQMRRGLVAPAGLREAHPAG